MKPLRFTRKASETLGLPISKYFLAILFVTLLIQSCKTTKNDVLPQPRHALGYIKASDEEYAALPKAPLLTSGTLPSSFFLEVPPTAFNQGQQGSCTSCATAMAKSIIDHLQYHVSYLSGGIIQSPAFLYDQAKADPSNCNSGSTCNANFNILLNEGICSILDMPYDPTTCSMGPNATQLQLAATHKISQFFTVDLSDIAAIKQYIAAGSPVIVAFQVDHGFEELGPNSVWSSFGSESLGWHCTLLYGWDDQKNAFKMLNSWGSQWADNGSCWIDFNFLANGSSPVYGKVFTQAFVIENGVTQNSAPTAAFDANGASTTLSTNQSISFYDRSTNTPTAWQWTFQGGSPATSTSQNPSVTYSQPGNYTVSLTASNQYGSNTKTITNYITVNGAQQQPSAQFTTSGSTSISAGASVTFVNQSTNNPTSFSWSFPGGVPSTSTSASPTVAYPNPGTYSVSLTASNQYGSNTNTQAAYISVASNQSWTCGQPFTDPRDGQVYQTIEINGQCWMTENLRYTNNNTVGIVYGNNNAYYKTLGCLYQFSDVVNGNLAPPGWHIPTKDEISALSMFILTNYGNNGGVLKSTSNMWFAPNLGATNTTGFNALPSGYYDNGIFGDFGVGFYIWTSTPQAPGGDAMILQYNVNTVGAGYFDGGYYLAVRCVKN